MSEPSAPPPEDRDWTYVINQGSSTTSSTTSTTSAPDSDASAA